MQRYRDTFSQKGFLNSAVLSLAAFFSSVFVIQPLAVDYAAESASNSVTDIVLSNVGPYDMDAIFVYGMIGLIVFIAFLCLARPRRLPFTIYALTLFVLIRCVFVSLTHLAPFSDMPNSFGPAVTRVFFGADLFFSGHTGTPFLMALVYWREAWLRYLFIAWSIFFGTVVLLGHYHYSIDVLAAFFITYGIFHIAEFVYPAERADFLADELMANTVY